MDSLDLEFGRPIRDALLGRPLRKLLKMHVMLFLLNGEKILSISLHSPLY